MVSVSDLSFLGSGLQRPECVVTHASGYLFAADWSGSGGVAAVAADGTVTRIGAHGFERAMRPNGIALEPDGSFLLADLGAEDGGVFRLRPDGSIEPVVTEYEGRPLLPTNFVHRDPEGRLWITISTQRIPRDRGYRPDVADGFILLADASGLRLVAEGLGYTNECHLSPDGAYLYVNETFARRLSRFPLVRHGSLGPREVVATFGTGTYPDGLTFDADGRIWITSIVSNRVIRIAPGGRQDIVLEDADAGHVMWAEAAFRAGGLGRPHLDRAAGRVLRNISSLAFGGPDLRTAYLGCLLGDAVASFQSPVPGHTPAHWSFPLRDLLGRLPASDPLREGTLPP